MQDTEQQISVIISAHNAEKYIVEAMDSIINQTHSPAEVIVVDDASTDTTRAILKKYADQYEHVTLIPLDKNIGYSNARNIAMEAAKSPWIAVMDADDIAYPERLEKQLKAALSDPEVVVWGSYLTRISEDGQPMGPIEVGATSKEAFYQLDRTQKLISLFSPTAFMRKDIALKVGGFSQEAVPADDSELWDRMAEFGAVVILPEPLLWYRQHFKSISATRTGEQLMKHRFILERYKRRQEGYDLSLKEFTQTYNSRPLLHRLSTYLLVQSMMRGRKARQAYTQKRYIPTVINFLLAVVLHPQRFIFGSKSGIY